MIARIDIAYALEEMSVDIAGVVSKRQAMRIGERLRILASQCERLAETLVDDSKCAECSTPLVGQIGERECPKCEGRSAA